MNDQRLLKRLIPIFRRLDSKTGIKSYQFMKSLYWYFDNRYNSILRKSNFIRLSVFPPKKEPTKLHVGCGDVRKENRINIDWRKTSATDFVLDIRNLPFKAQSIDSIESYHVIEHFDMVEAKRLLESWYQKLKVGGKIIIECPNFDEAAREYLEGNTSRILNIFGKRRFPGDAHHFGYNQQRLSDLLAEVGFNKIAVKEPTDYHKLEEPCMRVEAEKNYY